MKRWLKRALVALCSATLALAATALVGCSSCKKDKACEHEWQETVVTAATCTTDGMATHTCTKCGESKDVTIPAAHALETEVVEATCTTKGSKTTKCTVCDYENVEVLVATGHSYAVSKEVAATCTLQGYNEYTCSSCGDAYTEITADKTGHDTLTAEWTIVGELQTEDPCTWIQVEEATCATCGETVEHEEEIVKHEYSVEITKAATCSAEGEKTYTCHCGDEYTEAFVNAGGHAWVAGATDTATGITSWTCSHNAAHTKTSFSAKDKVAATIPASAIESAGEIELQNATIELPDEVKAQLKDGVDLAVDTLSTEDKNSAMAGLSEEEQAKLANTEIFNFQMAQGDDAVTKFDKEITVTVPYTLEAGADPADIAVWYIDDQGQLTSIKATYSVVEGQGYATFATDHFSYYTVVRLSAKERCALYGCEETTVVVAATCDKDGYTLTKCVRCNKTTRSAFVKALGHTYTENTVAPTCTAKGYTTYTCTREGCGHSYAAKWVDMTAHEYEAKVVEPTCTAPGYTAHICKTCGDDYIDSKVAAKGHVYAEGVCTVCDKEDPSYINTEEINFYFNAIEGLLTAETYYLELKGLNVKVTNVEYENRTGTPEYYVSEMNVMADVQAEVALDENGYLVGKGMMTVNQSETYGDQTEAMTGVMKVVLANGMLYMMAESEEDNSGKDVMKATVSQDAVLDMMGVGSMMEMLVGAEPDENITGIIESVKNTPNNPLNQAIAAVMEYVYVKTETADGYHFELNFNRITEVYQILTEKKINEVVDLVFGAGAYDAICNYLTTTVDKNVSAVVEDLTNVLALWGVEIDVVYDVINAMVGEEGFDIRTMVAQYSEMKVSDLLDGMMEAEEPMDYKAMIAQYAAQLKEVTFADLAMMIMGNMGGNVVPSPEQGGSANKPYPEDEKVEIMKANAGEEADVVYTTLVEIVEVLKKSSFSFETDKTGEVLSYTVKLVDLGVDKTVDEIKAEIEAEVDEDTTSYSTTYPLINGTMTIKPNGTMTGSFDGLITEATKAEAVVENYWKAYFAGTLEGETYREYYKDVVDGEIWAMEVDDMMDSQEDSYAGQPAMKMSAYGDVVFVTSPSAVLVTESDCIGWTNYYVQGVEYENVGFTVWVNEEGEVLGVDVLFGSEENVDFSNVADFYYNATTDTYVDGWKEDGMHNFVEIEHKVAEGCEGEGYHKYSCTRCGKIETYYYTNGHRTVWGYALSAGSTTCEDGVDRIETCTKCNEIVYRYKAGNDHYTYEYNEVVATTECGDVVMRGYVCPCGEEKRMDEVVGPCIFDCVSSECIEDEDKTKWDHYVYTYRCAVNECAYTYTYETYGAQEGCYVYEYTIVKFGVEEGSTNVDYTFTGKTESYSNHLEWHDDKTERTDLGAGIYEVHRYCSACDYEESHYLASYDKNGYTTYYKSLEEGRIEEWEATYEDNAWGWKNYYRELGEYGDYGYRRVYNGCEYVQYDLENNFQYEGDMHDWYTTKDPYSDSCTQYQFDGYYEYCYYCNETYREGGYSSPRDHQYEWSEDLGMYVCCACGMKSETGADAIVLEDLTYVNDGKALTVGYYNRQNKDYSVYIVANYGSVAEKYLFAVTCEDVVTHENSGIITINMQELTKAIESLAGTEYEVQTVSLVMQYFDPISGEYDETTGEWEGSYIDCVITFE